MEKRISILKNEVEILQVLKQFSPYLKSLRKGEVYQSEMAKKFANYAEFVVVSIEDNIAGFIAFYMNDLKRKEAYISMVAVYERYRRLGIGKLLLEKCIVKAKTNGMISLSLEVAINNKTAIAFYKNNDFEVFEESQNSYYMKRKLAE